MSSEDLFVLEADGEFTRVLPKAQLEKLITQTRIGGTLYLVVLKKVGEAKVQLTWGNSSEAPITDVPVREAPEERSALPEAPQEGARSSGTAQREVPGGVFIQPRKRGRKKSLALGN